MTTVGTEYVAVMQSMMQSVQQATMTSPTAPAMTSRTPPTTRARSMTAMGATLRDNGHLCSIPSGVGAGRKQANQSGSKQRKPGPTLICHGASPTNRVLIEFGQAIWCNSPLLPNISTDPLNSRRMGHFWCMGRLRSLGQLFRLFPKSTFTVQLRCRKPLPRGFTKEEV